MSYCRWSDDNMRSDVYAYEDCMGGYTIHVRGTHPINSDIIPEYNFLEWIKEGTFKENMEIRQEAINKLIYEPINGEYDSETFNVGSLWELYEKIEYLSCVGYYVPKYTLDMIKEEALEE